MVTSNKITNNVEIVGIVSWGKGCAQENFPGSYTNVKMYKAFIEKTIKPGECTRPDFRRFGERKLEESLDPDCKANSENLKLAKCNKVPSNLNGTEPVTTPKPTTTIAPVGGLENTNNAVNPTTIEVTTKPVSLIEAVGPTKLIIPHDAKNLTKPVGPLEVLSPTQVAMIINEVNSTTTLITAAPKPTITPVPVNNPEAPTSPPVNTGSPGTSNMTVTDTTPVSVAARESSSSPAYSNIPGNRTTDGVRRRIYFLNTE